MERTTSFLLPDSPQQRRSTSIGSFGSSEMPFSSHSTQSILPPAPQRLVNTVGHGSPHRVAKKTFVQCYDNDASSSLLTNHKIVKHLATHAEREKPPIASEGRNFALGCLECIIPRIDTFKLDFLASVNGEGELNGKTFVGLIAHYVQRRREPANSPTFEYFSLDRKRSRVTLSDEDEAAAYSLMSSLSSIGGDREASESQKATFEEVVDDEELFEDCLWRLFRALDVDESDAVSWEEFSDYMADVAVRGPVQQPGQIVHLYRQEQWPDRKGIPVNGLHWFEQLKAAAIVSVDTGSVYGNEPACTVELYANADFEKRTGLLRFSSSIVGVEHIPKHRALAVSSADLYLRFYDTQAESMQRPLLDVSANDTYPLLKWSTKWELLYAASSNGSVTAWRISKNVRSAEKVMHFRHHESTISQILFLPLDGSVVVSSMDPGLTVVEPRRGECVANLTGHNSAILDVSYGASHHVLVSCGFDQELHVWPLNAFDSRTLQENQARSMSGSGSSRVSMDATSSPMRRRQSSIADMLSHRVRVPTTKATNAKPILLRDRNDPHKPPIIGVQCVPGTPQIVSLDHRGLFKVWDLRTFSVIQNLPLYTNAVSVTRDREFCFMPPYIKELKRFILASWRAPRTVHYTNKSQNYVEDMSEEGFVSLLFSVSSGAMVTVTQSGIQTWELQSGVLSGSFRTHLHHGEVTAAAIDFQGRKVILGHRSGNVSFYSAVNGQFFGCERCGVDDILDVKCQKAFGVAFCVNSIGTVFALSEDAELSIPVTEVESEQHAKFLCVSHEHSTMLVLHGDPMVHVYMMRAERGVAPIYLDKVNVAAQQFKDNDNVEVTCATFLGHYPAFVVADSVGFVSMFTVAPHADPLHCVGRWFADRNVELSCMTYYHHQKLLYLGDASGQIHCFHIGAVMEETHIERYAERYERKKHRENMKRAGGEDAIQAIAMARRESVSLNNTTSAYRKPALQAIDHSDLTQKCKPFVALKRARVAAMLCVPDIGTLYTHSADRNLYAFPMCLEHAHEFKLGFLSMDNYEYDCPATKLRSLLSAWTEEGAKGLHHRNSDATPDTGSLRVSQNNLSFQQSGIQTVESIADAGAQRRTGARGSVVSFAGLPSMNTSTASNQKKTPLFAGSSSSSAFRPKPIVDTLLSRVVEHEETFDGITFMTDLKGEAITAKTVVAERSPSQVLRSITKTKSTVQGNSMFSAKSMMMRLRTAKHLRKQQREQERESLGIENSTSTASPLLGLSGHRRSYNESRVINVSAVSYGDEMRSDDETEPDLTTNDSDDDRKLLLSLEKKTKAKMRTAHVGTMPTISPAKQPDPLGKPMLYTPPKGEGVFVPEANARFDVSHQFTSEDANGKSSVARKKNWTPWEKREHRRKQINQRHKDLDRKMEVLDRAKKGNVASATQPKVTEEQVKLYLRHKTAKNAATGNADARKQQEERRRQLAHNRAEEEAFDMPEDHRLEEPQTLQPRSIAMRATEGLIHRYRTMVSPTPSANAQSEDNADTNSFSGFSRPASRGDAGGLSPSPLGTGSWSVSSVAMNSRPSSRQEAQLARARTPLNTASRSLMSGAPIHRTGVPARSPHSEHHRRAQSITDERRQLLVSTPDVNSSRNVGHAASDLMVGHPNALTKPDDSALDLNLASSTTTKKPPLAPHRTPSPRLLGIDTDEPEVWPLPVDTIPKKATVVTSEVSSAEVDPRSAPKLARGGPDTSSLGKDPHKAVLEAQMRKSIIHHRKWYKATEFPEV